MRQSRDLVKALKNGDREAFFQGMVDQFKAYTKLLQENGDTSIQEHAG